MSGSSRLFLEYPYTFFRLSWHILHNMETFQFIPTLFGSSGHFAYYLDILYSIRTFSKISGNSSANNELFAKTFRSALLTRWRGFSDSAVRVWAVYIRHKKFKGPSTSRVQYWAHSTVMFLWWSFPSTVRLLQHWQRQRQCRGQRQQQLHRQRQQKRQ